MKFNVVLISPKGFAFTHFLFDTAKLLMVGLESLGHDVILSENHVEAGRINVLLNAHTLAHAPTVQQIVASGLTYVIHQTELIGGRQVNGTSGNAHFEQCYLPLLRGARRVWDWSPEHVRALEAEGCRCDILKLGHHPALREIRHKAHKDLDVLFYGSVTAHRRATLEALARRGVQLKVVFDPVAFYRNDLIARSRIVVTMNQSETGHLPYFRIGYLVNNAVFVAGQRAPEPHWMEALYSPAPTAEVADLVMGLLQRSDASLREEAEAREAAFAELPMGAYLEPLLPLLA